MSECERCQERLVEHVSGELEGVELRAVVDHLADCELCQVVDRKLRVGLAFAARLGVEEPPEAVTKAVMKAARAQSGDDPAATTFSASMLPLPMAGFWGKARVFVVRPQFVMGTVMVLAVVFGAWYVPSRVEISRAGSGAPATAAPGATGLDPLEESGEGVPPPVVAQSAEVAAQVPGSAPVVPSTDARLERGLQAFGRSDYVAAIDELNAVVSAPDVSEAAWPTATHHLARSYRRHGDCESATRRYEQLFRRSPAYNQTHLAMVEAGACYRELDNEPRARELLELAVQDPATRESAQAELDLLGAPPHSRRPSRTPAPSRSQVDREPSFQPSGYTDSPY